MMQKFTLPQGLTAPASDFRAVRDGRRTQPFYIDVALDTAYTDAAPLLLPIAGNSLYIDARPTDGIAQIEFQDSSSDITGVPFYACPGFIYRGAFTQIRLTSSAQSGKKIRVVYGVDIDFQPGSVAQVAILASVPTFTPTQTKVTIAAADTLLIAANPSRKYLKVINNSASAVTVNEQGATAVLNEGQVLAAGGGWFEWNANVPTSAMRAISASGSVSVIVVEGN